MLQKSFIQPFSQDDVSFLGAYLFEKNNRAFLLSTDGFSILIDADLMQSIKDKNMSNDLMFKLVQHGLAHVESKVMCSNQPDIRVQYFMIDFTKQCNFNCIYCFRDFTETQSITEDCLDDVLIFIENYCKKEEIHQISLQFWGGEPLFALAQIEKTITFFQNTKLQVCYDLETNASLVTDKIAKQLKQWNVSVGVSVDGTPNLHNKQRCLVSGKDSFQLVENGISKNVQNTYTVELFKGVFLKFSP